VRCLLLLGGLACARARGAEGGPDLAKLPLPAAGVVDFRKDIQPIFARACLACHGAQKHKGGLRLDVGAAALKGGNSGPVIKPGDGAHSRLVQLVAGLDAELSMPPKGQKLTPAEVAKLRAWIDQGARWPKQAVAAAAAGQSKHWAFQPIRRPAVPRVRHSCRTWNAIDAFVLARLEAETIEPSPEADRATLLRLLYLDLIGLPPTASEVDAFRADHSEAAYENVVDRLLASPHYGERWGRHWLDVARYADSDGFEKDGGRHFAWRYRQWVINALNRDLPFDEFTVEQLAGDLLPSATLDQKMATGFHRNTLTNREGGVDPEQYRVEQVVDRVNTTARVFLGVTLGCAQCHDHKYDPFSQREYYQFFAFFNSDVEVDLPLGEKAKAPLKKKAAAEKAQTLALGPRRKTHVMIRGDFLRPGVEVRPGTPAILPLLQPHRPPPIGLTRLDLARWLVAPENPLTPRVVVNWVWHKYFGRGLVNTLEDFGTQGEKPSHPELLDWLASELVRRHWSLKALHRLIVTSATYRQSSQVRPELLARDPLNVLLARQSRLRLEAEVVRDVALASSGLLTRTVGGPSVRPPQPPGISELSYAGSVRWAESTGPDRYRRGLYTWFQRTSPYPMLMTFDAPDSNGCCVRRERSNTPLQALTLLNDKVFFECAQALGRQTAARPGPREAKLRSLFLSCLARTPSPSETERLQQLFLEAYQNCRSDPTAAAKLIGGTPPDGIHAAEAAAWVVLARAVMNLDEFVTRE
jgi:mono/diheme cytochrome c family protein